MGITLYADLLQTTVQMKIKLILVTKALHPNKIAYICGYLGVGIHQ